MEHSSGKSIQKEISRTQEKVYKYLYRVDIVEKMLENKEMPMEVRMRLEDELREIKEGILRSEAELKNYYGENRKTFIFIVLLMFIIFFVYSVYLMMTNPY